MTEWQDVFKKMADTHPNGYPVGSDGWAFKFILDKDVAAFRVAAYNKKEDKEGITLGYVKDLIEGARLIACCLNAGVLNDLD